MIEKGKDGDGDLQEPQDRSAGLEKAKMEAIIAAMVDAISVQDTEFRILYQNRIHQELMGDQVGRRCFYALWRRDRACEECPLVATFEDGGIHTLEKSEMVDGKAIHVEITTSPVRDPSGKIVAGIEIVRDISARKRLEDQLRQSQKMEAVGRLAGGIAHDFNNLLTIINGYSDLLVKQIKKDDPMWREVEEVRKAGERAASLTRQLLAFSRRQILQPKVLDLNSVLSRIDNMLHRLIGEDVDLLTSFGENLWRVKADQSQIEQVLMNLAVNSRDAMPAGGKLTIETRNVELPEATPVGTGQMPPGAYVALSVSDTGCGMDEATQSHLFEPFFTTKDKGKGTGLGLAMVYGIIKQSGGYIVVDSTAGKGTTVKLYFPPTKEEARPLTSEDLSSAPAAGKETVLVVEDQEEVRNLVEEILSMQGYTVLKAPNGDEALRLGRTVKKPIHLLLTDMVMPGMSGKELAERMQKMSPGMKVILMSGYADDGIIQWSTVMQGMDFLQKPFRVETLIRKVRNVLDA
jgi:PAS domain S-box-containing protein